MSLTTLLIIIICIETLVIIYYVSNKRFEKKLDERESEINHNKEQQLKEIDDVWSYYVEKKNKSYWELNEGIDLFSKKPSLSQRIKELEENNSYKSDLSKKIIHRTKDYENTFNNYRNEIEHFKKNNDELETDNQKEKENYKQEISFYKDKLNVVESDLQRSLLFQKNKSKALELKNIELNRELVSYRTQEKRLRAIEEKVDEFFDKLESGNLEAFPYIASLVADKETIQLEIMADSLNWGKSKERKKKIKSLRELRKETQDEIEKAKVATYKLDYLLTIYPELEDVLDTDYKEIDFSHNYLVEGDPVRRYISKDEWENLSVNEKNQLALDNYIKSHRKTKWQIGRDYELFVGYEYLKEGFNVDYYGSNKGLEDLGRDLICTKEDTTFIIQCKYWAKGKKIHEKHIFQLFGTTLLYCIDKNIDMSTVKPLFVTNIILSPMAKKVAKQLGVEYVENHSLKDYPRIKCNIGKDGKIYHLPMDQQYDKIDMSKKGCEFVYTVQEAVDKGFRRAWKWHGNE